MRAALRALLERTEFEVIDTAGDGLRALDLVIRHRPDVLLLDLGMPRVSGVEIIADVRRLSPQTRVVIVSGYFTDDLARLTAEAGAHAYVVKHDLRATLLGELRRVVG
jgi:DNA-binding NarL/FixJ family response regulator